MLLPFPLYFRLTAVAIKEGWDGHTNIPHEHWKPPEKSSDFRAIGESSTSWLRWESGHAQPIKNGQEIVQYDHTTLLWAPQTNHREQFLQVPYNVLEENVSDKAHGWKPLSFYCIDEHYRTYKWQNVWACGYWFHDNDINAEMETAWCREYLPQTYFNPQVKKSKSIIGITGRMSLLLAVAAFCGVESQRLLRNILNQNFCQGTGHNEWFDTNFEQSQTKIARRCIIISVGLDKQAPRATDLKKWHKVNKKEILKGLEEGDYGPILFVKPEIAELFARPEVFFANVQGRSTQSAHRSGSQSSPDRRPSQSAQNQPQVPTQTLRPDSYQTFSSHIPTSNRPRAGFVSADRRFSSHAHVSTGDSLQFEYADISEYQHTNPATQTRGSVPSLGQQSPIPPETIPRTSPLPPNPLNPPRTSQQRPLEKEEENQKQTSKQQSSDPRKRI